MLVISVLGWMFLALLDGPMRFLAETTEVIAVVGVFGGLGGQAAFAPRPEWPLWTRAATGTARRE